MNWREFLASIIDSLAWPATVALAVYLLRDALRKRIKDLKSLRYGVAEAKFGDAVQDAEATAAEAELPAAESTATDTALITELASEVRASPRAAVIEAWLAIELELQALATTVGIDAPQTYSPRRLAAELAKRGVIEPAVASVVDDLGRARNVAVHSHPYVVERDEVIEYVKLAGRVRSALRLSRQADLAARAGETVYDLLVYHDLIDPTGRTGGTIPSVGDDAEALFGEIGRHRRVVAVAPGVHEGRITVVLAHSDRPMPEIQAILDREPHTEG